MQKKRRQKLVAVNLFTQGKESLKTSEELFSTTGCQTEFDIDQELVKCKTEKWKLRS